MSSCTINTRDIVIPDGSSDTKKKIRVVVIRTEDEQIIRALDLLWRELGKRKIRFLQLGRHDRRNCVQFNMGIDYRDDYSPLAIVSPFSDVLTAYEHYFEVFQNLKMDTPDVFVLSINARSDPFLGKAFENIAKEVARLPFVNKQNIGIVAEVDFYMGKLTVVIATREDETQIGAG